MQYKHYSATQKKEILGTAFEVAQVGLNPVILRKMTLNWSSSLRLPSAGIRSICCHTGLKKEEIQTSNIHHLWRQKLSEASWTQNNRHYNKKSLTQIKAEWWLPGVREIEIFWLTLKTFGDHVCSHNLILIVLFLTSFWFHKPHSKNCFTESIKIGKVTSVQSKENTFIYIIYTYLKSYLQCLY